MKIPADALIADEKLTKYLLRFRSRNDKSRLLEQIGFTIDSPEVLGAAIRLHASRGDAIMDAQDVYGERFVLAGKTDWAEGTNVHRKCRVAGLVKLRSGLLR